MTMYQLVPEHCPVTAVAPLPAISSGASSGMPSAAPGVVPSASPGHFLHGNTPEYMLGRLSFLRQRAEQGDVVRYRLGCDETYLVNDPALCRAVLSDWERIDNAMTTGWMFLDQSYLAVQGRARTRPRRVVHSAMCPQRAFGRHREMSACVERQVARWNVGEERDGMADMMQLGVEMTSQALLGCGAEVWTQGTFELLSDIQVLGGAYTRSPALQERLTFARRREVFELMVQVVERLLERLPEKADDNAPPLAALMRSRENGQLSPVGLVHEICVLLLSSGSGSLLALSTLYALSLHPEERDRVEAELGRVLGGRAPEPGDLLALPYLDRVLSETMRLYPPVGLIPRHVREDCSHGDYRFPAGSQLHISPYLLHRHPRHWDAPERFWPDRFVDSEVSTRAVRDGAFLPFGSGIRRCIGDHLALIQVKLLLATLLQRVRLDVVPGYVPDYDVSPMGACYPSSVSVPFRVSQRHQPRRAACGGITEGA